MWREKNPMRAAYLNLKHNAKRRNKDFQLTFREFSDFAVRTDYLRRKGIYKDNYHIDRIKEDEGYNIKNIRLLLGPDNVKKYFKYWWDGKNMNFKFETKIINNDELTREGKPNNECPF